MLGRLFAPPPPSLGKLNWCRFSRWCSSNSVEYKNSATEFDAINCDKFNIISILSRNSITPDRSERIWIFISIVCMVSFQYQCLIERGNGGTVLHGKYINSCHWKWHWCSISWVGTTTATWSFYDSIVHRNIKTISPTNTIFRVCPPGQLGKPYGISTVSDIFLRASDGRKSQDYEGSTHYCWGE